jgi:adenosylcobinamide kinase / adenosylcobinamide-phosphate guanylyltransferase
VVQSEASGAKPSSGEASLLVLGGARSGKSRYAQRWAEERASAGDRELLYIATAQPLDEEMEARIARHRRDRGSRWRTREAPLDLSAAIDAEAEAGPILLVDCLTLWLSNLLLEGRPVEAERSRLVSSVQAAKAPIALVSNEVGLGIVPDNPIARRFRDEQGLLNQRIAEAAREVILMTAGLPLSLK